MAEENGNGSDVQLEVAGQKLNVRNLKSLNTVATVLTLFGVLMLIYILWMHQQEAKEDSRAFVAAVKEQTTAMREGTAAQREQTCMLKFEISERKVNAEWCRQVSGAK